MLGLRGGTRDLRLQRVVLAPWPGVHPRPLQWELRVLATGPPGMSPQSSIDVPQPKSWTVNHAPEMLYKTVGTKGRGKGKWLHVYMIHNEQERRVIAIVTLGFARGTSPELVFTVSFCHAVSAPCRSAQWAGLPCPEAWSKPLFPRGLEF